MQTYKVLPDDLRDSNLACHYGDISLKQVPVKYNLPSRSVREALDDLNAVNELIKWSDQKPLIQNAKRKQATKWASKYAKYESKDRELYTEFELKYFINEVVISDVKAVDRLHESYDIIQMIYYFDEIYWHISTVIFTCLFLCHTFCEYPNIIFGSKNFIT